MTVFICGGDTRQAYAAEELTRLGYSVRYLPLSLGDTCPHDLGGADILLLPTPATSDGTHLNCGAPMPPTISELSLRGPARIFGGGFSADYIAEMRRTGREVTDLLSLASFTEQNAALTAEAALGVGMTAAEQSMRGLHVAVIGYGRIASRLTRYLLSLGACVSVYARRESARLDAALDGATAYDISDMKRTLPGARLIFNTVPAKLLTREIMDTLKNCAVVELASGKENIATPKRADVTLTFAHSLPGKIFPRGAGKIIAQTLDSTLQQEGRS